MGLRNWLIRTRAERAARRTAREVARGASAYFKWAVTMGPPETWQELLQLHRGGLKEAYQAGGHGFRFEGPALEGELLGLHAEARGLRREEFMEYVTVRRSRDRYLDDLWSVPHTYDLAIDVIGLEEFVRREDLDERTRQALADEGFRADYERERMLGEQTLEPVPGREFLRRVAAGADDLGTWGEELVRALST